MLFNSQNLGGYPESAFMEWILNQYSLEEIKGFILHQFNTEYFVNQMKFQRFVKLCKLVDVDKHTKEIIQLRMMRTHNFSPTPERKTLKYNKPFIAVSLSHQDCQDK